MPIEKPKKKLKLKKKKLPKPKAVGNESEVQSPTLFDAQAEQEDNTVAQVAQALENITLRGRAYRLSTGMVGEQRSLSEQERAKVLSGDSSDDDNIVTKKHMYDADDPLLKVLRQARGELRDYFRSRTIAHPEPGVRLFVIRNTDKDWNAMNKEEVEQEFAAQLDAFHQDMLAKIDAYRSGPVAEVVKKFDEVKERARIKLDPKGLYDEAQYPTSDQLWNKLLYVKFFPLPSVLPPEYNRIDPTMRNQVQAYVREQMESALAQQLAAVEEGLSQSLDGLVERIEAITSANPGRFYASRITSVTVAIEQYEQTMRSLGISLGESLGDSLKKIRTTLKHAGTDPQSAIKTLRASEHMRSDLVGQLRSAISATGQVLSPLRRQIG